MLLNTLTPEQLAEIYPPYPGDQPIIVPDPNVGAASQPGVQKDVSILSDELIALLKRVERRAGNLETLTGPTGPQVGSNSWVVSGQLTSTGMPILSNDTHLAVQMPSIWYEVGLHCALKG